MSVLDRYAAMPEWPAWRAANVDRVRAKLAPNENAELQCLIEFCGLVDNGKLAKPGPAAPAPPASARAKPKAKYVSWAVMEKHLMPGIADGIKKFIEGACTPLHERIADLEKQLATIKANGLLQYRDVWQADVSYRAGDAVTSGGGMWVCKQDCFGVRPGNGSELWRLAVKRGRDARERGEDRREQRDVPV